jgi:hypothetical protein
MVIQNVGRKYTSPQRWVRSTGRKNGAAGLVHRATAPALKRKAFVSEKGPTFLKTYAIPTLLINLALASWDVVSVNIAHGWLVFLGYAVIVTMGLYLYLVYLDCYLSQMVLPPRKQKDW